jgi:hypothetical protein
MGALKDRPQNQPWPLHIRLERGTTKAEGDQCWLWGGKKNACGYGVIVSGNISPRAYGAHRVAWELAYGPIPKGKCVCHHCDTPACVRPDHLFLGTHKENMHDMIAKDRCPIMRPRAKWRSSPETRERIKQMWADGISCRLIARELGYASTAQVAKITRELGLPSRAHLSPNPKCRERRSSYGSRKRGARSQRRPGRSYGNGLKRCARGLKSTKGIPDPGAGAGPILAITSSGPVGKPTTLGT